jgi:hypothetical protein
MRSLLPRFSAIGGHSSSASSSAAASQPPSPRWGHSATRVQNKVIVFGGADHDATRHDVHVLDLATGAWSEPLMGIEAAGGARTWHSATHVTYSDPPMHAVFVFGGERPRTRGNERDEVDCVAAPMLLETELMLWYACCTHALISALLNSHHL